MARKNPIRPACERGFSLIEILVAIGIITLLVGLAIPVFSLAYDTAKSSQALAALAALESAEVEYESTTGLRVFHLDTGTSTTNSSAELYDTSNGSSTSKFYQPFNWGSDSFAETYQGSAGTGTINGGLYTTEAGEDIPLDFIERFIAIASQNASSDGLWRAVDEKFITDLDNDGFAEIIDPWGTPILYAAFVSHSDSESIDDFLPQRGDMTAAGGGYVPKSPAPFFVSAGPDGKFGDVNGTAAEQEDAEDNVYSYTLDKGAN
ncbi:MAG: type II secretion system protein [Planctomycetota bacterium]